MPRSGDGTYQLPIGNPVVPNTTIESAWANTTMADIAEAINDSVTRDGKLPLTGPSVLTDGTQAQPAIQFSAEPTMGFYRKSAGVLAITIGNKDVATFSTAGVTLQGPVTVDGGLVLGPFTLTSDGTYLYVATGNTNRVRVATDGTTETIADIGAVGAFA